MDLVIPLNVHLDSIVFPNKNLWIFSFSWVYKSKKRQFPLIFLYFSTICGPIYPQRILNMNLVIALNIDLDSIVFPNKILWILSFPWVYNSKKLQFSPIFLHFIPICGPIYHQRLLNMDLLIALNMDLNSIVFFFNKNLWILSLP